MIKVFDQFLHAKGESFSGVIVGAGALVLIGITTRNTKDIDVLDPMLPAHIQELADDFVKVQENFDIHGLKPNWLNNGPRSLLDVLPSDWPDRSQKIFSGKALTLFSLGRSDLLKTKLFAYCDRGRDIDDCIAINPAREELLEALDWVKNQDQNPGWPRHVEASLTSLARKLGYDL